MFPDYRANNPYQDLLAQHLLKQEVVVDFPSGYKRGLHFSRILGASGGTPYAMLHLHWPDPYLRGTSGLAKCAYAWKLRLDLVLALRGNRKLAWTVHNLGSHDSGNNPVEHSFYLWLAKKAAVLFAHDQSLVPEISRRLRVPGEKITVIPHGHYHDVYGAAPEKKLARKELGLPTAGRMALFLGMLRPYKGLEELLDIWPKVHRAQPGGHLVIVGGGNDSQYIEYIKKRCSQLEAVSLVAEFVEDSQIPLYYGAADLAVFPFRMITTSGSLILALSYNCPVVTPRMQSITGHLGFQEDLLYDPGSVNGLESSLTRGLTFDASRHHHDYERLKSVYSWEKAARLTAEAYRNCMHQT